MLLTLVDPFPPLASSEQRDCANFEEQMGHHIQSLKLNSGVGQNFTFRKDHSCIHLFNCFQLQTRLFLVQSPSSNDIKHERLARFDQ
jgi:hypothetical protein